jgi:hypothetical protein
MFWRDSGITLASVAPSCKQIEGLFALPSRIVLLVKGREVIG